MGASGRRTPIQCLPLRSRQLDRGRCSAEDRGDLSWEYRQVALALCCLCAGRGLDDSCLVSLSSPPVASNGSYLLA